MPECQAEQEYSDVTSLLKEHSLRCCTSNFASIKNWNLVAFSISKNIFPLNLQVNEDFQKIVGINVFFLYLVELSLLSSAFIRENINNSGIVTIGFVLVAVAIAKLISFMLRRLLQRVKIWKDMHKDKEYLSLLTRRTFCKHLIVHLIGLLIIGLSAMTAIYYSLYCTKKESGSPEKCFYSVGYGFGLAMIAILSIQIVVSVIGIATLNSVYERFSMTKFCLLLNQITIE